MRKELTSFSLLVGVFLFAYLVNFSSPTIQTAIQEAFYMLQWYARNHTLACVVPAMFIAGAIATFLSKEGVLRHLGPRANKLEAYAVASVAGTVLAVCSCSVLPMFAGIYRIGAGLGPASAFLYSGPAINVMAIFLTARVLGFDLGIARVIGAVSFAVIIGLIMAVLFRKEEAEREKVFLALPEPPPARRKGWQTALFLAAMIALLVFADWSSPSRTLLEKTDGTTMEVAVLLETTDMLRVQLEKPLQDPANPIPWPKGKKLNIPKSEIAHLWSATPPGYEWVQWIYEHRWYFAAGCLAAAAAMALGWCSRQELAEWMNQTWWFAKTIIPLLFAGVWVTGFVGALVPEEAVGRLVGGNSLLANFIASLVGAMWYFATLTEIPILEALIGLGMGRGPALALLLAGPALSLPSIAVIYSVWGFRKTAAFTVLTVLMSTLVGMVFGWVVG
ncbi:MAG: permease [Thermoguttaceae bacterium]|nr:permease [Thermoguttaceae bacterium]MDW8037689.1 permease [Thermoguttaceae bacterium]